MAERRTSVQLLASTASVQLLTKREAAARLRISVRKLDELRKLHELEAILIGRSVRFCEADLVAFVERQKGGPGR